MGPEATRECFDSVIKHTPAKKDQDHLQVIIDNNPQIPDRTEAILGEGKSPVPLLRRSARRLEKAGADFIIMPCNTAHYFVDEVRKSVDIPILDMVKATVNKLSPGSKTGLMATTGTIKTSIYQEYAQKGVDIITPSERYQEIVMKVIYGKNGIKAGYKNERLKKKLKVVAKHLKEKGVKSIIAGCTEIRLVLNQADLSDLDLITPIDVIAKKAVSRAKRED